MVNVPEFKPNFKYSNIGNVVGSLVYARQLERKDGTPFGHEFLINARGYGSINVRVPNIEKSQYALDHFSVADKPRVRMGLTQLGQFVSDKGKIYTHVTSFQEMTEAKTVNGADMPDAIKGRFGGEVFNLRMDNGIVKFHIVSYSVDKDGKRITLKNGQPVDPDVVAFEVHDPELIEQFKQDVRNGMNIEVGYRYINKTDVTYDEYGFPSGSGETIERVEVGKLVIHSTPQQPNQQGNMGGFGFQQQNNPFAVPQQQNPFSGARQLPNDHPLAQQAQQIFGNQGFENQSFEFGK